MYDFFVNQSGGKLHLDFHIDKGWKIVDIPRTDTADVIAAAFKNHGAQLLIVVVPQSEKNVKAANVWSIKNPQSVGGIRKVIFIPGKYVSNPNTVFDFTFAHEIGHALGLPDLYTNSGTCPYMYPKPHNKAYYPSVGGWDKMGPPIMYGPFIAWHRHHLGWIDAKNMANIHREQRSILSMRIKLVDKQAW